MLKFADRQSYHNLNLVKVSSEAIKQNYLKLQSFHPEVRVAPVLKSNAYGHGIKQVAPIFDSLNPPFLVVDSLYEAYELKKLKVKTPILILGYSNPDNFKLKKLPFHITVFDLKTAQVLNKYQEGCSVHIFVDTGMNREGVQFEDFPNFIKELKKLKNLQIVGLMSHFADADNPKNNSFTKMQIANYKKALNILEELGIKPQYKQISASGGAFKIIDKTFNIIRSGLASYGINPLDSNDKDFNKLKLQPTLTLTSTLVQIKHINKGDRVGYNGTFVAKKQMTIGLLPIGYYEGVDRRLSNKGFVKIKNQTCKILGRISMNMTSIDLSQVENPQIGDEVVIYSSNNADPNSLVNAAKLAKTIPYELLVHIAESVKRTTK